MVNHYDDFDGWLQTIEKLFVSHGKFDEVYSDERQINFSFGSISGSVVFERTKQDMSEVEVNATFYFNMTADMSYPEEVLNDLWSYDNRIEFDFVNSGFLEYDESIEEIENELPVGFSLFTTVGHPSIEADPMEPEQYAEELYMEVMAILITKRNQLNSKYSKYGKIAK